MILGNIEILTLDISDKWVQEFFINRFVIDLRDNRTVKVVDLRTHCAIVECQDGQKYKLLWNHVGIQSKEINYGNS
jgi:hypothetical protein